MLPRTLPPVPGYLRPVAVPDPRIGDDPYAIAAQERAGRVQANRIIVRAAAEWSAVANDLGTTR